MAVDQRRISLCITAYNRVNLLLEAFERIKTLSSSGEIDRICLYSTTKLINLSEKAGITKELRELKERRIDPLM